MEEKVQVLTLWHSKMCLNQRIISPCLEPATYPRIHTMVFVCSDSLDLIGRHAHFFFFKAPPDSPSPELLPSYKTHLEHTGRASSHLEDSGQVSTGKALRRVWLRCRKRRMLGHQWL